MSRCLRGSGQNSGMLFVIIVPHVASAVASDAIAMLFYKYHKQISDRLGKGPFIDARYRL